MRLNEIVNPEDFEMLISDVGDLVRHIERLSPGDDFAFVLDFDRRPIKRPGEP
jgi:hypothetical protein